MFQQLLKQDPSGRSFLPTILAKVNANTDYAQFLAKSAGNLLPDAVTLRLYHDRVLKSYGVGDIPLEACFEKRLLPPERFLKWLIENPDKMTDSPMKRSEESESTRMRIALFGKKGIVAQKQAQSIALSELKQKRASGSYRKWWAFEGFTEVDCYFETQTAVILIEGKRTEPLSQATMWYQGRNQLVRNMEVARDIAAGKNKEFGVILITEKPHMGIGADDLNSGLPHFELHEKTVLLKHFIGSTTWREVCDATGIDFDSLPNETAEVAARLKQ